MRSRGYALLPAIFLMSLALLAAHDAAAATTPGVSITASNVSVSDTGSGSSAYTVTSVGGFTGQVGVSCFAPELDGALVLPDCDIPQQFLTIPANGSATGKMPFTPPANVTAQNKRENKSRDERRPSGPLAAGVLTRAGFAAARRRLRWNRTLSAFALCAGLLAGLTATGCGGHGGLAMSHGTFGYTIQAVGPGLKTASAYINVTVH
jgi:hypothetical protein